MSTIHISLTPKLEEFIQELLDTGLYSNVSEIIREALREKFLRMYVYDSEQKKFVLINEESQ
jgi:putative addiction module CopG family antidote